MYERWTGKSDMPLPKVRMPRDFGYVLCLHRAGRRGFDAAELLKAGRRMLRIHLQRIWLPGGQYIRAATWLKIVYRQNDPTLTPLQTILKAYENMPGVPRPDFVSAV